jgi:hypothetical protein
MSAKSPRVGVMCPPHRHRRELRSRVVPRHVDFLSVGEEFGADACNLARATQGGNLRISSSGRTDDSKLYDDRHRDGAGLDRDSKWRNLSNPFGDADGRAHHVRGSSPPVIVRVRWKDEEPQNLGVHCFRLAASGLLTVKAARVHEAEHGDARGVCVECQFRRQLGSEIGLCNGAARNMTQGLPLAVGARRSVERA